MKEFQVAHFIFKIHTSVPFPEHQMQKKKVKRGKTFLLGLAICEEGKYHKLRRR